jgi:hypothetical protein
MMNWGESQNRRNRANVSLSSGAVQGSIGVALQTAGAEEVRATGDLLNSLLCRHISSGT